MESKTFPDSSGKYVCVLKTRRWIDDDMPFQFMLVVYDAQGNPLRNGTWATNYYIETVAWNGDRFTPWNAESPMYGGICYGDQVFWGANAEADLQRELSSQTHVTPTHAATEPAAPSTK